MPVGGEVRGGGADTALAGALQQTGGVPADALARCLDELRARREGEPGLSLAALLLERGLASAAVLERARAHLAGGGAPPRAASASAGEGRARLPERLGPYRVLRELARGGMGLVLEVEHEATLARYALKTVLSQNDPESLLRFRREAELLARLDHPHVVRVHAADLQARPPWFVVALLPGGTLARRLRDGGPLAPEEAVPLVATLARAMAHAHERGVLHRDLKPDNVLFDDQGEPCIVDLGLGREADEGACRLTLTGELLGTPAYMAPEQALGVMADPRTDVWGLGAILFAALTGRPPFDGASAFAVLEQVLTRPPVAPGRLRAGIPSALDALVLRALARERDARFASAAELAAALEAFAATPARARSWSAPLAAAAITSVAVAALALTTARPRGVPPATEAPARATDDAASIASADPSGAPPSWLGGTSVAAREDLLRHARAAERDEVERATAWLEREDAPLEDLRAAAWLRAARPDLPGVDEERGRRVYARWIAEARLASADAREELGLLEAFCLGLDRGAVFPELRRLERLAEALGAALLLGRWNPYDVPGDAGALAGPLVALAALSSQDTRPEARARLREDLDVRAARTGEPLFVCAWLNAERGTRRADGRTEERTSAGFLALERLVAVMPAASPARGWGAAHGELVATLRWRGRGQDPAFVAAEAARVHAGPRALLLGADFLFGEAARQERDQQLELLRRSWALLERVPPDERDLPHRHLRDKVDALALEHAPDWFAYLPPDERPPAVLPLDVRWGERPGEYLRASDGARLEWAPDLGFREVR